ncbi:MAG TPA: LptE family protein [Bacteroidales bacterium]|nr:LptE family protein [Bacteroidales bacterium]HRR93419.1 LptE family protein [Bacteroidales bacterium]HRT89028.1 LptE family protein [Bacteroidales bacterium]
MASAHNNNVFRLILFMIILEGVLFQSCKISYSFSGASISPQVKTLSVQYFQNRAALVQPGLSQSLTDALSDKCKAQTRLSLVNGNGDVNFEGEITDYSTRPLTVAADSRAAMNRFTISVKVKFTNTVEPQYSYEKTFTRYEDYDSRLNLSDVEKGLSDKIIELLVEDIFNAAFVNW